MSEIRIGHVIKQLLKERGRTLKEASRETGIPYSTLHTWFENRQPKDVMKALRLAQYLKVSLHYLLFGYEDLNENKETEAWKIKEDGILVGSFEVTVKKIK